METKWMMLKVVCGIPDAAYPVESREHGQHLIDELKREVDDPDNDEDEYMKDRQLDIEWYVIPSVSFTQYKGIDIGIHPVKADTTPSAFTMTYHDILDYLGDLGVNTDADSFDDGIVADMANDWIDSCEMSHDRRYRPVTRDWVYDRAEEYELEMED